MARALAIALLLQGALATISSNSQESLSQAKVEERFFLARSAGQRSAAADQLHAAEVATAADATSGSSPVVSKLRAELASTKKVSQKLRVRLDQVTNIAHHDLRQLGTGVEHAKQSALRTQNELKAALKNKTEELANMSARATEVVASEAELQSRETSVEQGLEEERRQEEVATANATKLSATLSQSAVGARRDKVNLLQQIAEMSDQLASEKKHIAESEEQWQQAHVASQQNDDVALAEAHQLKQQTVKQQHDLIALQEQTSATKASIRTEVDASAMAGREVAALKLAATKQQQRLQEVMSKSYKLRSQQDAAAKEADALRVKNDVTEHSVSSARDQLGSSQQELRELRDLASSKGAEMVQMQQQTAALAKQASTLNTSTNTFVTRSKLDLQNAERGAAQRVHDLEKQRDTLSAKAQADESALNAANSAGIKLKDELQKASDQAQAAAQELEDLRDSMQDLNASAADDSAKTSKLAKQTAQIKEEHVRLAAALKDKTAEADKWQSKAQVGDKNASETADKLQKLEQDNEALQEKIASLSSDAQRTQMLTSDLQNLRADVSQNASRARALEQETSKLREMKDAYTQKYESVKSEGQQWQSKADQLEENLTSATNLAESYEQKVDDATHSVTQAKTQEDEYFEENTQLQQQSEALSAQVASAQGDANESLAKVNAVRSELDDFKASSAKTANESHASWVTSQRELLRVRNDISLASEVKDSLQAELTRTTAMLTPDQRKLLGLPSLKVTFKEVNGSLKVNGPSAKPTVSASHPPAHLASSHGSKAATTVKLAVGHEQHAKTAATASRTSLSHDSKSVAKSTHAANHVHAAPRAPLPPQTKHVKTRVKASGRHVVQAKAKAVQAAAPNVKLVATSAPPAAANPGSSSGSVLKKLTAFFASKP